MSTAIHNCPQCQAVIIADTDECPDCGHVLDQSRAEKVVLLDDATPARSSETRTEECPHCGEHVRTGLLRCWNCNGFMRQDIEDRYNELTTNPQPIIYSDIPPDQRTELLPARASLVRRNDDDDGFTLAEGVVAHRADPTETADPTPKLTDSEAAKLLDSVDKPESETPAAEKSSRGANAVASDDDEETEATATDQSSEDSPRPNRTRHEDDSDLFQIAMDEQQDTRRRERERRADRARKTMLLPCSCGAWIRVQDSLAGMVVRCRQCRQPVQVPIIRRKETDKKQGNTGPELKVTWINDVWFHSLTPTSVVLKPGSAEKSHTEADIALTEQGLAIVSFETGGRRKSLLSFSGSSVEARTEIRKNLRQQVTEKGSLTDLDNCEVRELSKEHLAGLRLVQPVLHVHESMFAGVPIFGEGRIAVYLPLEQDDGRQLYCSFTLSGWRQFAFDLGRMFDISLPGQENGIPADDKMKSSSCFLKQSRVEFLPDTSYHKFDPAFELELSGYRCTACRSVISEDARKGKKIGGAAGKGIAKAKCPKCSAKMGEDKLYRLVKAPSLPGSDEEDE